MCKLSMEISTLAVSVMGQIGSQVEKTGLMKERWLKLGKHLISDHTWLHIKLINRDIFVVLLKIVNERHHLSTGYMFIMQAVNKDFLICTLSHRPQRCLELML